MILLIFAIVLFIVAALPHGLRFQPGWAGAACLAGALVLRWGAL
jgi:hypothetical protein